MWLFKVKNANSQLSVDKERIEKRFDLVELRFYNTLISLLDLKPMNVAYDRF
jgi:hypothetical protein